MTDNEQNVITVDELGKQEPLDLPELEPAPVIPPLVVPEVPRQPTETEERASELQDNISTLSEQAQGEQAFRNEQELALDPKEQAVQAARDEISQLVAEQKAVPLELQQESVGRGRTKAGVSSLETSRQRNITIKGLFAEARFNVAQGNLTAAKTSIDRAVAAKYDPIKADLANNMAQLEAIIPVLQGEQKERAEALKAQNDERLRLIEKQEAEDKERGELSLEVLKAGGSVALMEAVNNAETKEEAMVLASEAFQEVGINTDTIKLDNGKTLLINTDTGEIIKDFGGIEAVASNATVGFATDTNGNPIGSGLTPEVDSWVKNLRNGDATFSNVPADLRNAVSQGLAKVTQEVLDADMIKANRLLTELSKITDPETAKLYGIDDLDVTRENVAGPVSSRLFTLKGNSANFESYFNSVKDLLTLDNLGLMTGILTDKDIEILSSAASALNLKMSDEALEKGLDDMVIDLKERIATGEARSKSLIQSNQVNDTQAIDFISKFYTSSPENTAIIDNLRDIAPDAAPAEIMKILIDKGYSL